METIEEKVERITHSGMESSETLDDGFEIEILMAQIKYLNDKVNKMESVLDYISSSLPGADECHVIAEGALEALVKPRKWRADD